MQDTVVEDYGWTDSAPCSCSYLAPFVLELLGRLEVRRVLDLGAGNGELCSMLSAAGFDAVGVEYDPKGVEIARSRFPGNRFYSLGVQDDPERLMSREAPFDAVISTEVIEHLFSPHLLPQFARRTLSDDGYLIVSTPYHGYLKNLALAISNKWDFHHDPLWHGGHIKFWSRSTLTTLLERHGFQVTQFHGVGRLPYLWKTMVLVARKSRQPP
jgi:2-polyprenyl-3-methyl-5-hydroxy-6-metoxy-1,4-benzoquinol methylase